MKEILVLYYSRNGSVYQLAECMAATINAQPGVAAKVRTVPPVVVDVQSSADQPASPEPSSGPLYCALDDLRNCDGLLLGSPTRFGLQAI